MGTYFEGGVSSVYLWDLDHGFAGVILIKKAGDGSKKIKGCWDSIHVVEVQEKSSGRTAHYKLTSTVMLWLQTNKSGSGTMNLGGSLTRQVGSPLPTPERGPGAASVSDRISPPEIQRFGLESFYLWVKNHFLRPRGMKQSGRSVGRMTAGGGIDGKGVSSL
ncbi:hypothetical protein GH733_015764 [Mirounga leonina]|nr:hypothetical protein GH733_015764 [Mirounga leonina]